MMHTCRIAIKFGIRSDNYCYGHDQFLMIEIIGMITFLIKLYNLILPQISFTFLFSFLCFKPQSVQKTRIKDNHRSEQPYLFDLVTNQLIQSVQVLFFFLFMRKRLKTILLKDLNEQKKVFSAFISIIYAFQMIKDETYFLSAILELSKVIFFFAAESNIAKIDIVQVENLRKISSPLNLVPDKELNQKSLASQNQTPRWWSLQSLINFYDKHLIGPSNAIFSYSKQLGQNQKVLKSISQVFCLS